MGNTFPLMILSPSPSLPIPNTLDNICRKELNIPIILMNNHPSNLQPNQILSSRLWPKSPLLIRPLGWKGGDPMNAEEFKRKLTAILSADVEGYSRLMGEDEESTVRILKTYRKLIASLVQKQLGRVVDSPGDNILADFASVVEAVRCAVEIQEELNARNAELPENRRMKFRIGINLGDVIEEEEQIYGDGVNIAARVESLAHGGGICISGTAYDQIKNKLSLEYEDLGKHEVKNIAEPVRVYRIRMEPNDTQVSSKGTLTVELPDEPTIAVLPFDNMSGDPEQEYFSDGISEDIITDLSKYPKLIITARNSSFAYKGRPVDLRQVGRELGVHYVLEGSVRKSANRVRITAKLIEAASGNHVWASRYDRTLEDIFAIQDEITEEIVTALNVKLVEGSLQQVWRKYLKTPVARELYREGSIFFAQLNREGRLEAREKFERVKTLEPDSPSGFNGVGWTYFYEARYHWVKEPKDSLRLAREQVDEALSMDNGYPAAKTLLGAIHLLNRNYDQALSEGEQAENLAPNHAHINAWRGITLFYCGNPEKGMIKLQKAIHLSPSPPAWYFAHLAMACHGCGRYPQAIEASERAMRKDGKWIEARLTKSAALEALGRHPQAEKEAQAILDIEPGFSLAAFAKTQPYKNKTELEALLEQLRKAGLPD
jgi:adenylate cyclase